MSWALEQTPYLNLQDCGLLSYLAHYAWGRNSTDEGYALGYVRRDLDSVRKIAEVLNKRPMTIHAILTRLRQAGYISVHASSDKARLGAPSSIKVWWYEDADKMREMVRENPVKLPPVFWTVIRDSDPA